MISGCLRWNIDDSASSPSVYASPSVAAGITMWNSIPQIVDSPKYGSGIAGTTPLHMASKWSCSFVGTSNACNGCGGPHSCMMSPLTALDEADYIGDHEIYFTMKSTYDCTDAGPVDMFLTYGEVSHIARTTIAPDAFVLRLRVLPYKEPDCTADPVEHFTSGITVQKRLINSFQVINLTNMANGDCMYSHTFAIEATDPNGLGLDLV